MNKPIYLDYNATTPHAPEVISAMRPYLEEFFGNPSSSHWYGVQTKSAIKQARQQVASMLNCQPDEIVFTSGGTEANNYAITGIAYAKQHDGNHIIASQIEHPAVLEVCHHLEQHGFKITYLPVNEFGLVRVSDVEQAITPKTILITIMDANNEVGTLQPIEAISQLAQKHRITLHTDAAQSVGKIPTDVAQLGVDLLSIAGHKLYAPKGIGALYVKKGIILQKLLHGAGQESGKRAGTENVLEIVGMGQACEMARIGLDENNHHFREMADRLHANLLKALPDIKLNGHTTERLPNTLSIGFPGITAQALLAEIEDKVAVSAGSACHSGETKISPVLKAMNVDESLAKATLRFSTGRMTTSDEIDEAASIVVAAVKKLRRENPRR
jgi:cysteine desulfurase